MDPFVLGSIAGAGIGAAGSLFSGKQSADFAERAAKNKWSWERKSLEKAGFNPMLSLVKGGSPTVQTPSFPNMGDAAAKGVGAASAAALAKAQVANVEADTTLKGSATAVNVISAKEAAIRAGVAEESLPFAARNAANTAQRIQEEVTKLGYEMDKLNSSADLDRQSLENNKTLQGLVNEYHRIRNDAMRLGIPEAQATADFWERAEGWGKLGIFLKQLLK